MQQGQCLCPSWAEAGPVQVVPDALYWRYLPGSGYIYYCVSNYMLLRGNVCMREILRQSRQAGRQAYRQAAEGSRITVVIDEWPTGI